jgi:outer membrane protein TolC
MLQAQRFAAVVVALTLLTPGLGQAQEIERTDGGFFSGLTYNYRPHPIPEINWQDSPRIEQLLREGRIYLSLRDAIALALENNLDLEVARIGPRLSDANLQRANAGQLLRNVSSNVNSGPSSASLGVLSGAQSLGAGAVSGGAGNNQGGVLSGLNVQLAGSSIPNLDPVVTADWRIAHLTSPQSSSFVTGTNFLVTEFKNAQFGIQKGFLTGTTASLSMNNTLGLNQNSFNNDFNPTSSGSLNLTVTQNLLQGFGLAVNKRAIRVAKNQRHMSDLTFEQQVIATVANVVNLYFDLVSFDDSLKVRQEALEVDQALYRDNQTRARLGAIADLDVIQAEAEAKSAQQDVTTQELQVLQQEAILKSVLTRSGLDDPAIAAARIVPTDRIDVPEQEPVIPVQDLIAEALASRPEVAQSKIGLENSRINMLGTKSALKPTLQAYANLSNSGQAGQVNTLPVPVRVDGTTQFIVRTPDSVNQFFLGGYGTVLGQLFARNFPNYTYGLQLSVPLRNRAAQADLITDELNYRQSEIQDHQLENNIKLNTINTWVALSQARSAYDTSVEARRLQDENLSGQRRKYELGATAFLDVLIAQRDAVARRLAEVQALNQYVRARISLQQVTGRILKEYDVQIAEAVEGVVHRDPDPPMVNPPAANATAVKP